jgi:hypothetical protein
MRHLVLVINKYHEWREQRLSLLVLILLTSPTTCKPDIKHENQNGGACFRITSSRLVGASWALTKSSRALTGAASNAAQKAYVPGPNGPRRPAIHIPEISRPLAVKLGIPSLVVFHIPALVAAPSERSIPKACWLWLCTKISKQLNVLMRRQNVVHVIFTVTVTLKLAS